MRETDRQITERQRERGRSGDRGGGGEEERGGGRGGRGGGGRERDKLRDREEHRDTVDKI